MADKAVVTQTTLDAIGQAIIAKGGATAPMTPAQMPAAIAAIPSGDYTPIEQALKVMTGADHTGETASELAQAITEITRKPDRRGTFVPPRTALEEYPWLADFTGTAWKIRIERHEVEYCINRIDRTTGHDSFTVDWGDGSTETVSYNVGNASYLTHSYSANGDYIIKVDGWFDIFDVCGNPNVYPTGDIRPIQSRAAVIELIRVGEHIKRFESGGGTPGCFRNCTNLRRIVCPFPSNITSMYGAFYGCSGLTGTPDLTALTACTSMYGAFYGCSGLTGTPDLSALTACKDMSFVFSGCHGITGVTGFSSLASVTNSRDMFNSTAIAEIPDLSVLVKVTSMFQMFSDCRSMRGRISAWPPNVTNVTSCFLNCDLLDGVADGLTDDDLMPAHITSYGSCVTGCGDEVRSHFLTTWGGSRNA